MSGQQDLPGHSPTQETQTLGLLAVQIYLVRHGFNVTEVTGRFDDGLDLLVSPHDEANVLPAIAGIRDLVHVSLELDQSTRLSHSIWSAQRCGPGRMLAT